PDTWFEGTPEITVDRGEIVVVGRLSAPESSGNGDASVAEEARIARFREETRGQRVRIAAETEARYGRKVSWGAECAATRILFTPLPIPAMSRWPPPVRQVLDTLVGAGVARSRSDALAWGVRLVGAHESGWIGRLKD